MRPTFQRAKRRAVSPYDRKFRFNDSGASAVEFALIVPFLLFLVVGLFQFGIAINNYLELTDGVRSGGRQFAISRSSATPYTSAVAAVKASAANLTAASVTVTVKVNGTACGSDGACTTALSAAAGGTALTTATYPCNLTIMSVNFAPGCTLTSSTSDLIE
jgi:Flp pilus assembly protein TadG